MALATELGELFQQAIADFYLGWSDSHAQDPAEGLARMQRALADINGSSLTMRSL